MRLFLHIGFPKTATTYIQAVAKLSHGALKSQGYFYPLQDVDPRFCSHVDFLELVKSSNLKLIDAYLASVKHDANIAGCDNIVLSHEELLFAPDNNDFLPSLLNSCRKHDLSACHVLTTRPWDAFFTSYVKQIAAIAGSTTLETLLGRDGSESLANYISLLLKKWNDAIGREPILVSLNSDQKQELGETFFQKLGCNAALKSIPPQNVRHNNSFFAEMLSGLVAHSKSIAENKSIHSDEMEAFKASSFSVLHSIFQDSSCEELFNLENQFNSDLYKISQILLDRSELTAQVNIKKYFF